MMCVRIIFNMDKLFINIWIFKERKRGYILKIEKYLENYMKDMVV